MDKPATKQDLLIVMFMILLFIGVTTIIIIINIKSI
jgi:hypothetical protein